MWATWILFQKATTNVYLYDANYGDSESNAVSIFRHPLLLVPRYKRVKTIQYGVTTHGKSLRGAFLQTTWLPPHEVSGHSSQSITWDTQSGKRERKSKEGQGEKENRYMVMRGKTGRQARVEDDSRQPIAVSDISIYICLIDIRSKSKEQLNERRAGLSRW